MPKSLVRKLPRRWLIAGSFLLLIPTSRAVADWFCPPSVSVVLDCGTCAVPGVYGVYAQKVASSISGDTYIGTFTDAIGVFYSYTFVISTWFCVYAASTPWQDWYATSGQVIPVQPPWGG